MPICILQAHFTPVKGWEPAISTLFQTWMVRMADQVSSMDIIEFAVIEMVCTYRQMISRLTSVFIPEVPLGYVIQTGTLGERTG